ncbi:MAG: hypothetical protein M1531_06145, partial [Chloroflexi bacterium]|nr:hypothetical protein [Chloroflexota bacterium]
QYTLQVELLDGAQPVGPPVTLGTLDVQERPHQFDLPSVQSPLAVDLGGGVRLLGYDLSTSAPALGQTVRLTLYWQARGSMDTSYTVFVHLLDGEQKVVSQHDGLPGEGRMPTTAWAKDEVVSDTHELALPRALPAGTYQLEVGMYDAATGERLPVAAGGEAATHVDAAARRVLLRTITLDVR